MLLLRLHYYSFITETLDEIKAHSVFVFFSFFNFILFTSKVNHNPKHICIDKDTAVVLQYFLVWFLFVCLFFDGAFMLY